ncbi:hypothetical protein SAMN05444165_5265 [Paraburkholderia phenazinium]|uniref:Uncharacterized protein n=1 Tax=Paraburkholderia phenazinium TaxID=60549 RepID=A0A1N6KYB2_9BURK|nr:hypothetical protein SAMN05444165_5265 [Paraburkholderia phenazinium]
MTFHRLIFKLAVFTCLLFVGGTAFATPVRCSPGYVDSTCTTPLVGAPIPAPQCSSGAGWTTTTPAQWIGSGYTTPTCNYTAPPVCSTAAGWTTVVGASWNGSSWSDPSCSYTAAPVCPGGYTEYAAPTWTGSTWTAPGCTPNIALCPGGYSCSGSGIPYAIVVGYCGVVSESVTYHGTSGIGTAHLRCASHPVFVNNGTSLGVATGSLAGSIYWITPGATSPTATFSAPSGTLTNPELTLMGCTGNTSTTEGANNLWWAGSGGTGGHDDTFCYSCPAGYSLNTSTVFANSASNPGLAQCTP